MTVKSRFWIMALLLLSATWITGSIVAKESEPADNSDCFMCHDDTELIRETTDGTEISMYVDPKLYGASAHKDQSCLDCHHELDPDDHPGDKPVGSVHCNGCHKEQSRTYGLSIHAEILKHETESDRVAPDCAGCHGSHNIVSPANPHSPLHFLNLIDTCGGCHESVAKDVSESIHGQGRGHKEAPVCTDCHSEHNIQPLSSATSIHISGKVCSECHISERLNTKYNLGKDRVRSFLNSYHGLASKLGSTAAANCASCHGYHLILPPTDPRSTIHPKNLLTTCGECHPGASENFAQGSVHHPGAKPGKGDLGATVNYWVRVAYIILILTVIGLMLLHNGLAWRRKVLSSMHSKDRSVLRMNRSLRIQHFVLALSFIYLTISGFALAYPDSIFAWVLGANEEFRRWSHRLAGVVLIILGIYHVFYLIFAKEGRKLFIDMLPRWKDFGDLYKNISFFLSHRNRKARFTRFGYPEKAEYWAVVWGSVIMGITGFAIWFKIDVTHFFPRWVIEVATTIHLYEAILAVLAIIVWHFYHVIFDPDVYPMNWSWYDGKADRKWYEDEHPLDLEGNAQIEGPEEESNKKSDSTPK